MWIELHHLSIIRQCTVSPLGYHSPVLGNSVPVPGPQEAQCMTLQPRVTTSTLSCVPQLFTSVISSSRIHQEANSEQQISPWWRHCTLHQDEILECLTMEEMWQVSFNNLNCQLTMVSPPPISPKASRSQMDGPSPGSLMKPLLVHQRQQLCWWPLWALNGACACCFWG